MPRKQEKLEIEIDKKINKKTGRIDRPYGKINHPQTGRSYQESG